MRSWPLRANGPDARRWAAIAAGLVAVMRQAVESARMGWGLATMCGVAGKGETLDIIPRYRFRQAGDARGG